MKIKRMFFIFSLYSLSFTCLHTQAASSTEMGLPLELPRQVTVETIWGEETITEPLLIELLHHPIMQRIKKVEHLGPLAFFNLTPHSNRYDHCVGVMLLVRKAGEPIIAQAAALLHDASHTAFSHLADYLFGKISLEKSHQDDIHTAFLESMNLEPLIEKYGYTLEDLNPENESYKALDCKLPDICADRIQYNLQVGVKCKKLTHEQARQIYQDVSFKDNVWFFQDQQLARLFCNTAIDIVYNVYDHPFNCALYHTFANILKKAIELDLITYDTVQYETDEYIMSILTECKDFKIQTLLKQCYTIYEQFTLHAYGSGTINHKARCRAFDPYITQPNGSLKRLTEVDPVYKSNFEQCKQWCQTGYAITLNNLL